jgi:hypothetical protein
VLNPTDNLSITLRAEQWNGVLAALEQAPWRIANPLIEEIKTQADRAANTAGLQSRAPLPRSGDGPTDTHWLDAKPA